jgi:(p)ppGpp synthase/HD superfamily hydrolase
MINLLKIVDSIDIERQRRVLGLIKPDPHAVVLWDRAIASLKDDAERIRLKNTFEYAKSIKYKHIGLTSEIYFSHPLRVAALSVLISGATKADIGILGLLHNVLEVSDISEHALKDVIGSELATQISTLTVDRTVQWSKTYKIAYYQRIMGSLHSCRVVKIVDKLDNLFLLYLNQDEKVKEKYLNEIESFILPMTQADLPDALNYLKALVTDCRKAEPKQLRIEIN